MRFLEASKQQIGNHSNEICLILNEKVTGNIVRRMLYFLACCSAVGAQTVVSMHTLA